MTEEHDAETPHDHMSPSSHRDLAPASAPVDLEPLVDELARVLNDADEARLVAYRAGVPPAATPAFDLPRVFWHRVIKAAADGNVRGGAGTVAGAATKLYPDNPVFRRWARLASSSPDRVKGSPVAVLVGLAAVASAVAAWQWWASSRPDDPPPVVTNNDTASATSPAPPAAGSAASATSTVTSTSGHDPVAPSTTDDASSPLATTPKRPGPRKPPLVPTVAATEPAPPTPTADPRRWKVLDVATNPDRFIGKRVTLDAHAPAGAILTLATRCESPTINTAGPRCLVREDADDPDGHYCFTRDPIPRDASLCIHPQGIKADSR